MTWYVYRTAEGAEYAFSGHDGALALGMTYVGYYKA